MFPQLTSISNNILLCIALLVLPIRALAGYGYIPTSGQHFYCPPHPPSGVTCCERKWIENNSVPPGVGAISQPKEVMECDRGEGFFVSFPFPAAGDDSWKVRATVGTSDANFGSVCFEVQVAVTPRDITNELVLDDAFGTADENSSFHLKTGGVAWSERSTISDIKMFNSVAQANCNSTSCDEGRVIAYIHRDTGTGGAINGALCHDTKNGKAWVSTIQWIY